MARLDVTPTKSNLFVIKEQLGVAKSGYTLLDQKREILVMDLMRLVEKTRLAEQEIDKLVKTAYPTLQNMLMSVGGDRVEEIARSVKYEFAFTERSVSIAGMHFSSLDVVLPKMRLFHSSMGSYAASDKVMVDFFQLLRLLTELASIRTIVWRLARELQKTQRRVNALDKIIIPQTKETKVYIEGVIEERDRENIFVLKSLKSRQEKEANN